VGVLVKDFEDVEGADFALGNAASPFQTSLFVRSEGFHYEICIQTSVLFKSRNLKNERVAAQHYVPKKIQLRDFNQDCPVHCFVADCGQPLSP